MKIKLLLSTLLLTLTLCSIFGLTACGGNNDNDNNIGGGNSTIAVTSVTLNHSSLNLEIGDTVSLYETIYPSNATDKSVTWSSSNTSVATVSNGMVTAKSAGTVTITVKASNNRTATCSITVNNSVNNPVVAVSSVSLNKTSATIEVGDTLNLTATIYPSNATDKSVTWSSSNTSVATVSKGTVTAKSAGTVTITVKASNNRTATCSITVNNPVNNSVVAVSSVSLNKISATIEVGDTLNLTATIYPSNATDKSVSWSSSNTSVATVSSGIVTAKSAGTVTITVKASNNRTATCSITVNNQVNNPVVSVSSVSLNKTSAKIEVGDTLNLTATIYPNNATDKSVTWSSSNTSVATVSNGTVTAKSAGTVTITVKASNNRTATCEVTVIPKQILPTAIWLSKTSISLEEGDETIIVATMLPTNATNKAVDWLILDTSIARVDNGKITAVAEGETMLIVTTANGLTATCSIVVTSPFVFELVGGSYALKSYNGTATEVVVPSSYKGKPVTAIGVPQEVVTLNATGFAYSTSVKKIVLPDTINTLYWGAFYQCQSLEEVNIPNDVKYIGFYLFYGCSSLKKLSVSLDYYETLKLYFAKTKYTNGTIEYLSIPSSLETVVVTGTKVGSSAFEGCSGLKEVIISDSVTSIGSYAFSSRSSLTSIVIGNSVTSIDSYMFSDCSSLKSIVIPDSVKSIGDYTFYNCSSLKSIVIPDSVTRIGDYTFYNCSSLTSVVIPDSVTWIGEFAFSGCSSLTSVVIPDSVKRISEFAFSNCSSLTSVVIPDSVTWISDHVFYKCSSLKSIVIPDSVTGIGGYAFGGCKTLTSIKYRGTESQWQAIFKSTYWNHQTGFYTITYNYTGE